MNNKILLIKDLNINKQKGLGLLIFLAILSNLANVYAFLSSKNAVSSINAVYETNYNSKELYLLEQAKVYVYNIEVFEKKVREVSKKLQIPPEWLMAVMYNESKFDASVSNLKGSGAVGLIQWMPETAKEYDITTKQLKNLNHCEQLDFVETYLQKVKKKYGKFNSLTDLYLAILYPKALSNNSLNILFKKGSVSYTMNAGLDEDNDGKISVLDIDLRMKRLFPSAYRIHN